MEETEILSVVPSLIHFHCSYEVDHCFEKRRSKEWIFRGIVLGLVPTTQLLLCIAFLPQSIFPSHLPFPIFIARLNAFRISAWREGKYIFVAASVAVLSLRLLLCALKSSAK
jgi:hypothetical protein